MNDTPNKDHQNFIRELRLYYSLAASIFLLVITALVIYFFHSSLENRKIMFMLRKAKTLSQIEQIMVDYHSTLSDEQLAEIYSRCAVDAFNRKDYDECEKLLLKIINSQAHIEYIAAARLELAYLYWQRENFSESRILLKSIIDTPNLPNELKQKAKDLLANYEK